MADGKRLDPFRGYNFRVIVNGFPGTLGFQKVTGLEVGLATVEYREGTDPNRVRKLPGLAEFPNITLERGVSDNASLVEWMQQLVNIGDEPNLNADDEFRREVTIEVLSSRQEVVRTYVATAAFPVSLKLGDLDAGSSDVLIETLELAHEGLSIDTAASQVGATG